MTVCRDDHPHVVTMLCYVLYTQNAHATAHGYIVMASGLVIVGHGHKAKCFSRSSIGGVRLITTKVVVAHTTQWLMEQKKRVIQRLLFRLYIIYDRVKCVKNYFLLLCDAFVSSVYMYVRVQFRLGADTCECSHIILDFNAMHNAWPECVRQKKSATARFREQLG